PLAVEQGEEGSEVEKNIPFKQGEPDWDLVLSHMQGERPVISKLYNQRWNFEKGMEFDGSSNAVDIGNPNELQLQDSVTLMGWINNHDTTTFGGGGVLGKHSRPGGWTSCDYAFVRRQEDSISFAVFDIHGDGGNISTYAIPPENTWFHLTGIYNRTTSTLSILINGIVVTSRELIIDDIKTNGIFKIGGEWYSEGDDPYFKGQIGNVSV
ncbi:MAG: LamG-like jellyroll fold domain-containing protein, partial [bacterium]